MLLRFSIENWMSFQSKATFSLISTRERQHGERIPKVSKYNIGILPIAAVYGGNASGKTNLFKALDFVKKLVVTGTQLHTSMSVEPFKLGSKHQHDQPSRFEFELLIDENIYAFNFSIIRNRIVEEKLVKVLGSSEKILYHRENGEPNFDDSLKKDKPLEFAFKGTRDNQLFLTNSVSQKIENFKPIYDWFNDTLELIAPDSRFEAFEHFLNEDHHLYAKMNRLIPLLDTGIVHLRGEEIPFENLPIPKVLETKLKEELAEGVTVRLTAPSINERVIVTRKNGELISKKLVTDHLNADGIKIKFEMRQESDGSKRVIDLLPAFLEMSALNSKKVYVIDEVDRSLHTLLIRRLLEAYLSTCSAESRSQLLFTTHNVLMMDQDFLRRDEMWITERDSKGASSLLSFSEYKDVRNDKDLKKSYLQGRLGGIPHILLNDSSLQGKE